MARSTRSNTGLSRRTFIAGVGAAGATGAVFRPAYVRAAEPVVIGTVPANAVHWVQCVAHDKGFYKAEGFESDLQRIQSSPQSVQMCITGGYHVATAQPDPFIAAFSRGATQLGAISSPSNYNDWLLVGSKAAKTPADLKGKTIGLSALRGTEAWATTRLLSEAGVPAGSYEFVVSGVSPAKVAALARDAIGAAVLFQPSAEVALRQGFPALGSYAKMRAYPTILYVVNREWATRNENGPRASRAIAKAHAWMWDRANAAECVAILVKYSQCPREVGEIVYKQYFVDAELYSKTGQVDVAGLQTVLNDMAADGSVFKTAPEARKFLLEKELGGLAT